MRDELARSVLFGMAAGVVATVVMDTFVAMGMIAMGNPAGFMFVFIGQVAAKFFALVGIPMAGSAAVGFLFHYLFGMAYGGLFCAALSRWTRLKPHTLVKTVLLGILYIEISSQPFLASAPLLLTMTASDVLQWYVLSTVMHAVYGLVLGVLEYHRNALMRLAPLPVKA